MELYLYNKLMCMLGKNKKGGIGRMVSYREKMMEKLMILSSVLNLQSIKAFLFLFFLVKTAVRPWPHEVSCTNIASII